VRLWGNDATLLPASIREISAAADPVTRTFLIKADIGSAGVNGVRLGQTATVVMDLPQTNGVTKLPLSALREEQGKSTVWLVDRDSMTVKAQPVTLAGADGNDAVITAGLAPGQVVVTAGVHVLNPGQKVKFYVDPGILPSTAASRASGTAVGVK
jgi:multidrug efflux system membrane fusion protein